MDNAILKKRLNTFKSAKGKLSNVSDEVVLEVLRAWENWPGTAADLYRELGLSKMQLVILLKHGKQLVKSGVAAGEFSEVKVIGGGGQAMTPCPGIELVWAEGKVLRFSEVEVLLDFLKKTA
jgi:hypothetical protein